MASTQRTIPAKPSALKDRILNDEPVSFEEYLERDANDERRLEFYDGWIVNVTGATLNHNLIIRNLRLPLERSRSDCRLFCGDMRVVLGNSDRYAYPDIVMYCGSPVTEKRNSGEVLMNPLCIAEALSPSTVNYDRGEKSYRYRQIDTLQTYLVVAQDELQVTLWTRGTDDSWRVRDISGLDASFSVDELGVSVEMKELYADVFDAAP
jgi:Uma2 family endonuclease